MPTDATVLSFSAFWAHVTARLALDGAPEPQAPLATIGIDSLGLFELTIAVEDLAGVAFLFESRAGTRGAAGRPAEQITAHDVYMRYVDATTCASAERGQVTA